MGARRKRIPKATPTLSDTLKERERVEILTSARKKIQAGEKPTKPERIALERWESEQALLHGVRYLRSMPKQDYTELFGGSAKVNIDWREDYGFPWPDKYAKGVDVTRVLRWYREQFISGGQANGSTGDDIILRGASVAIKDEYVREKVREKRITNQQKAIELEVTKSSYMPTEAIVAAHNELADRIRKTRERLVQQFDGEQRERIERAFEDLIEDYIEDLGKKFGIKNKTNEKASSKRE